MSEYCECPAFVIIDAINIRKYFFKEIIQAENYFFNNFCFKILVLYGREAIRIFFHF